MRRITEEWLSFAIGSAAEDADEHGITISFPFTASEVVRVYTFVSHPAYDGDGLWFQIKGGKIFNCLGQREAKRKSCFSGVIEGDDARDLAAYAIAKLNGFQPTDYTRAGE